MKELDGIGDEVFTVLFPSAFDNTVRQGSTVFVVTITSPAGDPLQTLIVAA